MSSDKIHSLLEKYWNCETTVQEESELQSFFSYGNVPEEFQQYIPLFSYIKDQQAVTLSSGFDERLQEALEIQGKEHYITIRVFRPLLRIAVSLLLIIAVGVSFYFISKQDNRPQFVETFEDPNAAMQQAAYALEKLSHALCITETASRETIHLIDDLDFDWSIIDSLGRNNSMEVESVKNGE